MPHYLTFWQLVENSPEWVGVFVTGAFGLVSTLIIFWQVIVMRRQANIMKTQGEEAARLLKAQNLLIRWQHEHEWMLQCNKERQEILSSLKQIELETGALNGTVTDESHWMKLQELTLAVHGTLRTMDEATFSTPADQWFVPLKVYLDDLLDFIGSEYDFYHRWELGQEAGTTKEVRDRLHNLILKYELTKVAATIETSIRIQFAEFKFRWDKQFPA